MQANELPREELSVRTDDRHQIGIDAKDRHHYVDPLLGVIWVTIDDKIAHVEPTHEVERWVTYTADHVGWTTCNYSSQSTADWLATALTQEAH